MAEPLEHAIAEGGNVVVPALLALEAAGFNVSQEGGYLVAASENGRFVADDPVAILGLVKLVELRGWSWQATDTQIDTTLKRFGWAD